MIVVLYIAVLLTIIYALLMLLYRHGWRRQPVFQLQQEYTPHTSVSVIIPARNEEGNISECLRSLLEQDYPEHLLEIIVVDDHSTDSTAAEVLAFDVPYLKLIRLAEHMTDETTVAYKKQALATGIGQSRGELVVTTDADCTGGKEWLKYIAAKYEQDKPVMIVAPVDFTSDTSLVQVFQSLDFMTMQGITVATIQLKLGNMSNGANLAFSRKAFDEVGGYTGVNHIASGDDYLLMMKLNKQYPNTIKYLKAKQAIVRTPPQPDWGSFFQQRIRWASKSGKYNDTRLTVVLLLVYLYNLSLLLTCFLCFFDKTLWLYLLSMLVVKSVFEAVYFFPVASFFRKRRQAFLFPFMQPLHITYVVIAGFLGVIGVYKWKGRTVK